MGGEVLGRSKFGLIHADLAVALSLSLSHKAITFDRRMPDIDYDALNYAATGTLPVGVPGAIRADGCPQQTTTPPAHPTPDPPPAGG